jgi:hypothetical protein
VSELDHDHAHPPVAGDDEPAATARARALEELLVSKGVVRREDVRRMIDWLVSRTPADGARLIARGVQVHWRDLCGCGDGAEGVA